MFPCFAAGLTTTDKVDFLKGMHSLLGEIENIHSYCNTGNAHGGQASGGNDIGQRSLTGHCFTGLDYYLKCSGTTEPLVRTTLLEGTKWVKPMFATSTEKMSGAKICRNACLDCPTIQMVNQLSSLLMELTKIPEVTPTLDLGCAELQILQGVHISVCALSHASVTYGMPPTLNPKHFARDEQTRGTTSTPTCT
jgi:hypothetical protein